jgi:hypothetical protein
MPVASSGPQRANLTHVNGTAVPSTAGRPEVIVNANNDKAGYSLTAGSYSVRASSNQFITGATTTGSASVSHASVTVTRAKVTGYGVRTSDTTFQLVMAARTQFNATSCVWQRQGSTGGIDFSYDVEELL